MSHIAEERQDNVSGVIIGGNYIAWRLFYDGRPQGGKQYTDDDATALAQASARIDELKATYAGYPCYLYPSDLWEVRLWP